MTPERSSTARRLRLTRTVVLAGSATVLFALVGTLGVLADSPAPGSEAPASAATAAGTPAGSAGPAASGANAISIILKTFQPSTLTINAGDTVTWTVTQAISDSHSVTSGSYKDAHPGTEFDSGIKLKNNGDTFSHLFTTAGTFPFFCQVHPDTMSGTITVLDANGAVPTDEGPIPVESKLIAGAVLLVALVVLFGSTRVYRRMNPGP